ncbi:MAG: ATP-dependent helicase [Pseudomonadota bacterium]|jgi:mRNA-degrading endonuclease RelE of RelBE toxin-antitoxin system
MNFRIADTFTDSLARLTGEEQKLVKTTAFDLQMNPVNPGMSLHKIDRARDKNFWSVRVGSDLRLIVHRTASSLMLCYVNHHDKAYHWAERRRLEVHPTTGAAQWVEVRERVEDVVLPRVVEAPAPAGAASKPPLFAHLTPLELLSYGVPQDEVPAVLAADDDSLLVLAERLPGEAAEALLELATGGKPKAAAPPAPNADPFAHPDAQRRFRVMRDVEELTRALDYPWEKWTVFLHPAQRQWVEKDYNGPARVAGSAGTGKTIVALHRAVHLARRNPDARVLLTTFSDTLARALKGKLRRLISNEPKLAERLEVDALGTVAMRLHERHIGKVRVADDAQLRQLVAVAAKLVDGHRFAVGFVFSEWRDVVDTWQIDTWEGYRDFKRLGRKTRLSEAQRAQLWQIFQKVAAELAARGLATRSAVCTRLTGVIATAKHPPYDHVVIDEAQDVDVGQLRLLAAIAGSRPNGLLFAGDLGQRIFQTPFSWKALGVDVRGRSRTLHVNYRTSHQIRAQADRLLGPEVSDVDGNTEDRRGTVSVFNGPAPEVLTLADEQAETAYVAAWLGARIVSGMQAHELGVFVRSGDQIPRAEAALQAAGLRWRVLDDKVDTTSGQASISTMHLAKGLEFRCVVVMACDDEVIPLQERIEAVTDEADLEEVYHTERHLLYVACTRARDELLVSAVAPGSEFLGDLLG